MKLRYSIFAIMAINASVVANEVVNMDKMSVTATKIATPTKEISESISVVDEKTIEDKNMLNVGLIKKNGVWKVKLASILWLFKKDYLQMSVKKQ